MGIRIRRYNPADRAGVTDLVLDIQQGEFGLALTQANQADLRDLSQYFGEGANSFWVAQTDTGEIVGCIGLEALNPKVAVMRKFMVHQDWRGSDKGIAKALLETFEVSARGAGFEQIVLSTVEATKAAQRFYEKSGYRRVDHDNLPDGYVPGPLDTVFFVKRLTD